MDNKTEKEEVSNDLSSTTKARSRKLKEQFKEKQCKIINYNSRTKTLDINFDGYGIRIKDVELLSNDASNVQVKYKGEIGKPNFIIRI